MESDGIGGKGEGGVMTGEETVGDVIGEFCGEETDGRSRTNIVPMVTVTTHAIDRCQGGDAIACYGYPR